MAEALAKDLEMLTGTKCEAMEGGVGRRPRHGGDATPGFFIRTIVYKVAWETFIDRKDASEIARLIKKTITISSSITSRSEIKEVQKISVFLKHLIY